MRRALATALPALALLLMAFVASCDAPLKGQPLPGTNVTSAQLPPCVATTVRALTSPSAPVRGTMACQGGDSLGALNSIGVNTDADFEQVASSLGMTAYSYAGRLADGGYVFLLSGGRAQSGPQAAVFVVWLGSGQDDPGKVVYVTLAGRA